MTSRMIDFMIPQDMTLINSLNSAQVGQLLDLYRNEFWCKNRNRPEVEKMLRNTDVLIGILDKNDMLVGFVRALTDYTYKANIYDLIVHPEWRGRNLGRILMDAILSHPELSEVEHFDLNCLPDMHAFYEKWNFTHDLNGLSFMRCFNRKE